MRRIVVGGADYFWRHAPEDDWGYAQGADIVDAAAMTPGERGRTFTLRTVKPRDDEPGWWDRQYEIITPRYIRRAIEIALRRGERGDVVLTGPEVDEVFDRDPRLDTQLAIASDALRDARWPAFVRAWLAIGCRGAPDDVLDDWIACRSAEIVSGRLAPLVGLVGANFARVAYEQRSALAFVLARCERIGVAHGLDLRAVDAKLATLGKFPARPWGIPESHAWWTP